MRRNQRPKKYDDTVYMPYLKLKLKSKGKIQFNKLQWTRQEQQLYVEFLRDNTQIFTDLEKRKKSKVFVSMSLFIQKRSSDQCRSHHQKMLKKCKNIQQIIRMITQQSTESTDIDLPERESQENINFIEKIEENKRNDQSIQIEVNPQPPTKFNFQESQSVLWNFLDEKVWLYN